MWHVVVAFVVGAVIMLVWIPVSLVLFIRKQIGTNYHGKSTGNGCEGRR